MKIAVVGVGTAGLMSLCHFLAHSPKGTTVTAVYDPAIDILGIGESSTWGLPKMLFQGTGFNLAEYADWLDATPKFGVSWKNWRDNDFESVIQPGGYGIHFNNFKMKEFCFMRFEKMWQDTFKVIEGTVSDIVNNQSHASVIINNNEETFDLVAQQLMFDIVLDLEDGELLDIQTLKASSNEFDAKRLAPCKPVWLHSPMA